MKRIIITAMLALGLSTAGALADTTINVLSINRDTPEWKQLYLNTIKQYNDSHPGVTVKIRFMEDEAFKQKLPTLLQSEAAPDIFFSWSGGNFYEQARQGLLKEIPASTIDEWKKDLSAGGLAALSYEGKYYGAPEAANDVVLWYNKDLAKKVGIDPEKIKTYDDFLDQVKAAKAAGVTPIIVGGQDKWPLHFYYSMFAIRIMGQDGMAATAAGENGGFDNADWIKAGQEFKRLIDLKPFQDGFMGVKYDQATGLWGDGKALFHLMGDWDLGAQRSAASSGGLSDDQLGLIRFPMIEGGKGKITDTFGGASGFVLSKHAPDEAIDFLHDFLGEKVQEQAADNGIYIPTAPGAASHVKDPILKQIAQIGGASTYHQLFLDQFFGSTLGGAVNDASAQLATGDITPEDAAKTLEETRQFQ